MECSGRNVTKHGTKQYGHIARMEFTSTFSNVSKFSLYYYHNIVEPPNKGHIGTRSFVLYREVSFIRRLKCTGIIGIGQVDLSFIERCSECPLSEVPLYYYIRFKISN